MTAGGERRSHAVSRRRAVVGAAWAAPVIVTASAAPALAMSPGAAVIRTNNPSFFLRPGTLVAITTSMNNLGTAAPASMNVAVSITATSGTIADQDPVLNNAEFVLTSRTTGPMGTSQTLMFTKVDPQIPANGDTRLSFDIDFAGAPVTNLRAATVVVSPTVPPPSTATAAQNTLTSTA